ncbi:MAG: RNA polymerase sigma factor [Spirochaetia bacterium]|nr:RNA polymerase sigma factor [Spirochaetia bacterium]
MNQRAEEDREIISRFQSGDSRAFDRLVDKYKKDAFNIAYRYVNNKEDAEDISQQAFMRVYGSIKSFRNDSSFSTWFYRITVNLCLDFRKKRGIKFMLFSQTGDDEQQDMSKLEDTGAIKPSDAAENNEAVEKLRDALKLLPDTQKTAFILNVYNGMDVGEIAGVMKCAQGTVKSHLARAIKKMRTVMDVYLDGSKR